MIKSIFWAISVIIIITLAFIYQKSSTYVEVQFDISLIDAPLKSSDQKGSFYYDVGHGFNESDSVHFKYNKNTAQEFQHYQIVIPTRQTIKTLRYDPLGSTGTIKLKNIKIKKFRTLSFKFDPGQIIPLHSIAKISVDQGLTIVAQGEDPYLILSPNLAKYQTPYLLYIILICAISLSGFLGIFFLFFHKKRSSFSRQTLKEKFSAIFTALVQGKIEVNYIYWSLPGLIVIYSQNILFNSFNHLSTIYLILLIISAVMHLVFAIALIQIVVLYTHNWMGKKLISFLHGLVLMLAGAYLLDAFLYVHLEKHISTLVSILMQDGIVSFFRAIAATGIASEKLYFYYGTIFSLPIIGSLIYHYTLPLCRRYLFTIGAKHLWILILFAFLAIVAEQGLSKKVKAQRLWQKEQNAFPFYIQIFKPDDSLLIYDLKINRPAVDLASKEQTKNIHPAKAPGLKKRNNIFLFIIESLRDDIVTPKIAPHLFHFKENNISSKYPFANSNATHHSWFAIFHSIYPLFWNQIRKEKGSQNNTPLFHLKKNGYKILAFPSFSYNQLIFGENLQLADYYLPFTGLGPAESDRQVLQKFKERLNRSPDQDGHLFIILLDSSHHNYFVPQDFKLKFKPIITEIDYTKIDYSPEEIAKIKNKYKNSVYYVDTLFGKFIAAIKKKGWYDDSIIIVTGDHGEEFFEHGHLAHSSTLFNEQIRVALFFKLPKLGPKELKIPISHVDIMPTILDYIGTYNNDIMSRLHGKSILPIEPGLSSYALTNAVCGVHDPFKFSLFNGKYKLLFELDNYQPLASKKLFIKHILDHNDQEQSITGGAKQDYSKFIDREFKTHLLNLSFIDSLRLSN